MEYKLVANHRVDGLNHDVNKLLKEGWQLHGEHRVTMTYDGGTTRRFGEMIMRYSQAVIKHNLDTDMPAPVQIASGVKMGV